MKQLFMLSSKISASYSSPSIGEVRMSRGAEGNTAPNPSYSRRGKINAKVLLFVIFAIFFLTLPPHADAFSQCQSDKKGYCVRLDPPNVPKTTQRNFASLLFAAAGDVGPPFPGLEFLQIYGIGYDTPIGKTLSALYNFGVAIAGISALIWFTLGGILYLTSAGSTAQTSKARGYMTNALLGLALVASSYLILYTIDHRFTNTLSEETIPSLKGNKTTTAPPATEPAPGNVPDRPFDF